MFDYIKRIIGLTDCRGCVHRRWGGLRCSKEWNKKFHRPSLWSRYGCWHYAVGSTRGKS